MSVTDDIAQRFLHQARRGCFQFGWKVFAVNMRFHLQPGRTGGRDQRGQAL